MNYQYLTDLMNGSNPNNILWDDLIEIFPAIESLKTCPQDFYNYNGLPTIIYLEEPYSIIKKRNSERDTTLSNKNIDSMLFKWDIPKITEYFDIE